MMLPFFATFRHTLPLRLEGAAYGRFLRLVQCVIHIQPSGLGVGAQLLRLTLGLLVLGLQCVHVEHRRLHQALHLLFRLPVQRTFLLAIGLHGAQCGLPQLFLAGVQV